MIKHDERRTLIWTDLNAVVGQHAKAHYIHFLLIHNVYIEPPAHKTSVKVNPQKASSALTRDQHNIHDIVFVGWKPDLKTVTFFQHSDKTAKAAALQTTKPDAFVSRFQSCL